MSIVRKPCPRCKGTGEKVFGDDFEDYGKHMKDECSRCHGTGFDEFREGFEEMLGEEDE